MKVSKGHLISHVVQQGALTLVLPLIFLFFPFLILSFTSLHPLLPHVFIQLY